MWEIVGKKKMKKIASKNQYNWLYSTPSFIEMVKLQGYIQYP